MIIQTGMRTDIPAFCTKNPVPMLPYMNVLKPSEKGFVYPLPPNLCYNIN